MEELEKKLAALHLQTRKALTVHERTFGLKEAFLYCLQDSPKPTRELIDVLRMKKSNLALLAIKCEKEGLIEKLRTQSDGRLVCYTLTESGKAYIDDVFAEVRKKFATILTDEKQVENASEQIDSVTEILSYL
ncbi:MAG: winged helix DNA-binding protein [Clostridiales bacterium]|nr:winged helix DNA-binding protein [Clostridiales bacterium]